MGPLGAGETWGTERMERWSHTKSVGKGEREATSRCDTKHQVYVCTHGRARYVYMKGDRLRYVYV